MTKRRGAIVARARRGFGGMVLAGALLVPSALDAQVRASERGTVSQVVDGTTISLDYGRPLVRDRSPVFPDVVEWGHIWTPGANASTTLEIDRPIHLEGVPLDSGRYSVWLRPAADGPWRLMLDADAGRWHTQKPDTTDLVLDVEVEPTEAPPESRAQTRGAEKTDIASEPEPRGSQQQLAGDDVVWYAPPAGTGPDGQPVKWALDAVDFIFNKVVAPVLNPVLDALGSAAPESSGPGCPGADGAKLAAARRPGPQVELESKRRKSRCSGHPLDGCARPRPAGGPVGGGAGRCRVHRLHHP